MFYSDRKIQQDACDSFITELNLFEIEESINRTRNFCGNILLHNIVSHTLKTEFIYHKTFEEVRVECFEWIEEYYNNQFLHSSLGYRTHVDVEVEYMLRIIS